ncbi:hypothetical protein ACQPWY_36760 [Pseudonocardia xinjiangensis]|uniref:hypothetical protein n=1 Tax=Pseudonocardia xinjiangensis TaxID=75289 RepID=UPI003D8BFCC5
MARLTRTSATHGGGRPTSGRRGGPRPTPQPRRRGSEADQAELFLYPGDSHLFADSSLAGYDPDAAALVRERVLAFLAGR